MTCRLNLEITRKQAELKLKRVLKDYYWAIGIRKNNDQVFDDAHHLLLDISEDEGICFKDEKD